jgi:thiol-disulfide isomerase/thioredoxin
MKKLLLLLIALTLGFGLKAQCPLTTAIDFTATDCHGTEVHLFDILDGGQYVLIDFFFTTCGPCQQATPNIVQSYYSFGCNMHDVYYMEISVSDADPACQTWVTNYGVEYPTIGTTGGGGSICNQYQISYYPTVILIAPDRSIVIQDLWPIGSAQAVINALTPYGIEEHECSSVVYEETLTFDTDTLWISQDQNFSSLTIYNNTAEPEVHLNKITIDTIMPWFYFIYGDQQIALDEEIDIPIAQGDSIQIEVWGNIYNKEMYYPVLSFENTLETVSLVTAIWWIDNTQETESSSIALFPNPANESLTLKGEDLGLVSIYNALGQKMDEFYVKDELNVNTAGYENGMYVIKTENGTVSRFVVKH